MMSTWSQNSETLCQFSFHCFSANILQCKKTYAILFVLRWKLFWIWKIENLRIWHKAFIFTIYKKAFDIFLKIFCLPIRNLCWAINDISHYNNCRMEYHEKCKVNTEEWDRIATGHTMHYSILLRLMILALFNANVIPELHFKIVNITFFCIIYRYLCSRWQRASILQSSYIIFRHFTAG